MDTQQDKPKADHDEKTTEFRVDPLAKKKVTPPRLIYGPDPEYSKEGRKKHREGTAVLWVTVTKEGKTADIFVARPVGYGLDEKAVEAVKKWRFEPAKTADGTPVEFKMNVQVEFRLK